MKRTGMFHCRDSSTLIFAWARLDGSAELADTLGEGGGHATYDAPRLILRAFQKWGVDAPARLQGEFSFAIYDGRSQRLFAARDPIGIRPLYWWRDPNDTLRSVVATSIPGVMAASERDHRVEPDWVARYLAGVSMSRETTPYKGIEKVPPAHWLDIRDGKASVGRYHAFSDSLEEASGSAEQIIERYRELLRGSIRSRFAVHERNGIETSGGLDSSTVLGFAMDVAQQSKQYVHGFGFANHEGEAEAILSVSQATGLRANHLFYSMGERMEESLVWDILGHPAEHGNAAHHYPFYRLAEQLNVQSLLSGFGGDEGVTNYAPNFQREMMARRQYRQIWKAGGTTFLGRARYMAGAIYRANRPSPYAENIMRTVPARIADIPLRPDVIDNLGIGEQITRDAQYDWPIPTLSGFSIHMLGRAFVSTRTESCSLAAANFGVEYFWPLLDTDLIAYFLAAPTQMKVHDRVGRALHRAAVEGIVPDNRRLARGKYIGEFVQPMPGFAPPARDEEVADEPLHPMLDEMLDAKRMNLLENQCGAAHDDPAAMRAQRMLRLIGETNRWLSWRK